MNTVPLHGGEHAIKVNYFSYKMLTKNKKEKEIMSYQNSWVTDIEVTEKNRQTLVKGGRCKWKIGSAPQAHENKVCHALRACA